MTTDAELTGAQVTTSDGGRPHGTRLPLAVDLDGTLIRGDLFVESILRFVFGNPLRVFVVLAWLLRGRAYAKARLAAAAPVDPAYLPYDEALLAWLREERAQGRTLALATASDERAARAVAEHVGLFDAVFASDGKTNLKSARKAEALGRAYPHGFVYAGNERADLKVWAAGAGAVVVNASPGLARVASQRFAVERAFPRRKGLMRAFVKAIRPQQWAKNFLVFVAPIMGHDWADLSAWRGAGLAFVALSLTASSVYLVNDAADIDADRRHHRKRTRPFASGALSPALGLLGAAGLLAAGMSVAAYAGLAPYVAFYLAVTTAYTFWLKRVQLVDVFVLAGLYLFRVVLGGVATENYASSWLLAFCCFFFLSLALAKRAIEVDTAAASGKDISGRGYRPTDGPILKTMGVSAGLLSCLVLAFYLQSDIVSANYGEPILLWALPASIMFWVCRVWLLADRGVMHDDPLVFAARDRVSWLVALVAAAGYAAAALLPPGLLAVPAS